MYANKNNYKCTFYFHGVLVPLASGRKYLEMV